MKKIFYPIAASVLLFGACKKVAQVDVALTGVDFAAPTFGLLEGTDKTPEVVFTPADATNKTLYWQIDDDDVATVDQNGLVTAIAAGSTTIYITSEDGDFTASCTVSVYDDWMGTVTFRTNKTWTVGTQTWSDVVMATRCLKDDYSGVYSSTDHVVDCRQNGNYGHLFSWMAVSTYAAQLCPAPWRTPVMQDFVDLDILLGGDGENKQADMHINNYVDPEIWGGEHGGYCWVDPADDALIVQSQGTYGLYWSGESANRNNAAALVFGIDPNAFPPDYGASTPKGTSHKNNGYPVRCIK